MLRKADSPIQVQCRRGPQETHSMLLSLPAHLRSMILQLVLGVRTVYIDTRLRSLRVRLCIAIDNDSRAIQTFDNIENQYLPRYY